MHILSDLGIWSAYFTIPVVLAAFVWRRRDLPFRRVFVLFAAFILLCGTTHLMEAAIFWWPAYRLAGVLKLLTAVVSWMTVFALVRVAPSFLAMRSPAELEREITARKGAEEELLQANADLERRVEERTRELTEAVADLGDERERLRITLEGIGDGVIATDVGGRVTFLNPVAEALTGWATAEATGVELERVFNIVNGATREPVENPALRALTVGTVVGLEHGTILISKDGTERPVDDSAAPIRNNGGEIVGGVRVFRDVTERKQAEETIALQVREMDALYATTPTGLFQFDANLRFVRVNAWTAAINGRSVEAHIGCTVGEVLNPEVVGTVARLLRQVMQTGEPLLGIEVHGPSAANGEERDWLASYYPVRSADGEVVGVHGVIEDITERKRANLELANREAHLRRVINNQLGLVGVIDRDGILLEVDERSLAIAKARREQVIGKHFADAPWWNYDPEVARQMRDAMGRALAGEVVRYDVSLFAHGDEGVMITFMIAPVFGDDGKVEYLIPSGVDIRERYAAEQKLRESEARFRDMADNIPQLAWIAVPGTEGKANWFNKSWLDYTGTTFEQMQGSGWISVHHPDSVKAVVAKFEHHVKQCLDWEDTFRLRGKDGVYRWFLSRMKVIRDESGTAVRIFGTNTDVTDQLAAEEKLRQLAADLSEADRRKDEFLATLAHELRNPLAPIRNGLHVMKLSGANGTDEQVRSMMERQLTQMVRLVDDLLDVSRISQGKIELRKQPLDMRAVIDAAVETSLPLIEQAGHELAVVVSDEAVFVDGDPTRLAQVVSNLLTNSAKYTHRGGHIRLTVRRDGDTVAVSVADDGIGIPPTMLDKVFVMFTQVDRTLEKTTGGLGIGLSLVRGLVEMHGGAIEARSEGEGKGSEFVVRLPVVIEASKPKESDAAAEHPVRSSHRILVVDDNRDGADSLSMMLEIMGNDIRTAYDGQEGVDVAEKFRPNVILLDIGLPTLNGYEACRRIREQPWGTGVVLIAVTGWGQDEDRRRSHEAGFDHHMVKPVDPQSLMKLLARLKVVTE